MRRKKYEEDGSEYFICVRFYLLLGGLLLCGLSRFNVIDINHISKLPYVIIIMAIGLLVGGACELFIKPSKEMEIESKDERNIMIAKAAKAFGFDVMTVLFSLVNITLMLFRFISISVFFVLFAVYMISQITFIMKLRYMHNRM